MFPNPQEALPLPPRPSVEQYRKLAKELVKSCKSDDSTSIRAWATRWISRLAAHQQERNLLASETDIKAAADQVEQFARRTLSSGDKRPACQLTDAQFVIARSHGFLSWPAFVTHIESLPKPDSPIGRFETAASAIVAGDLTAVKRLLHADPDLIRARSTREHRATLLHYVSANGVEGYRQISPKNIAAIAGTLLEAGAEVDAEADVYGGGCTALELVATSSPPFIAGVQQDVIDVLLANGARVDRAGSGGHGHLVHGCLANGQPKAAEYLASRGAPLDFPGAAGIGRLDAVERFFDEKGRSNGTATGAQIREGYCFASTYGRVHVVEFLLDRDLDVDTELTIHGAGHTALHVASFHARLDVVALLIQRGASVHVKDKTWGTPPLIWALTGWGMVKSAADAERYYDVVARLVDAGSNVRSDLLEWDKARADPRMMAALTRRRTAD